MRLSELKIGQKARVITLGHGDKAYRQKLAAMGILPGTCFVLKRIAPLGDPIEIEVRGFSLTLRKVEADNLQIEGI